ncbi:MAG: hypothetical protein JRN37_00370 [Nitrososphaerota archaeon]|jgi:hypothetical protein|nr:hypothetical protein [Nitrososphaerota archaeon]MDG7043713.1 hypothetical protein [Nitrososphaerota archaeon]
MNQFRVLPLTMIFRAVGISIQVGLPIILATYYRLAPAYVGFAISAYWLLSSFGGLVSSYWKKKILLDIGLALSIASLLLLNVFRSAIASIVIFSMVGFGISMGYQFLPVFAFKKEDSGAGISIYGAGLSLGAILGTSINLLYSNASIEDFAPYLLALLCGVAMVIAIRITYVHRGSTGLSILRPFRSSEFRSVFGMNFINSIFLPLFTTFAGVYGIERYHISSLVIFLAFIAMFFISLSTRFLLIRVGMRRSNLLLTISFLSMALSFGLIAISSSPLIYMIGFLLYGLNQGIGYPVLTWNALRTGGDDIMNSNFVYSSSSSMAEFLAPTIGSVIAIGSEVNGVFVFATVISALALVYSILNTLRSSARNMRSAGGLDHER